MITIIDYNMGNIGSIINMFKKLGIDSICTNDKDKIKSAEKLLLPGVGHFKNGMKELEKSGLIELLNFKVLEEKTPILGICLGMQLMTNFSEEGNCKGLGWVDSEVKKISFDDPSLKIPHMGWNKVKLNKEHQLLNNLEEDSRFYFVHSYAVKCNCESDILTYTHYGNDFVSSFQKENILGVQFHPEKSHKFGMQLLKNFANIKKVL